MKNGITLRDVFEENDRKGCEVKIWKGNKEFEGGVGTVKIHNRIIEVELSWSKEFLSSAGGRCAETTENFFVFDGNTPANVYEHGQISAMNKAGASIFICPKGQTAPNPAGKM